MTVIPNAKQNMTYGIKVDLVVWQCPDCGIVYGVPEEWTDHLRDTGGGYYCPNGHRLSWRETEADRQRRRADEAEAKATRAIAARDQAQAAAETERHRARALRGHITRLRNRIAAGVCPVPGCKRTGLTQTKRHIEAKHPDWWALHATEIAE